jgi:hypothetical protein
MCKNKPLLVEHRPYTPAELAFAREKARLLKIEYQRNSPELLYVDNRIRSFYPKDLPEWNRNIVICKKALEEVAEQIKKNEILKKKQDRMIKTPWAFNDGDKPVFAT